MHIMPLNFFLLLFSAYSGAVLSIVLEKPVQQGVRNSYSGYYLQTLLIPGSNENMMR